MARPQKPPQVIVIGGPNGAGKSTAAAGFLKQETNVGEFVNADTIAAGLAAFSPERAAIAAGRVMLDRIHHLVSEQLDFAFETTLASRSFLPFLRKARDDSDYQLNIVFVYLRSPALAVRRVRHRVRNGGHSVPEDVIARRFGRGIRNFVQLYLPIADRFRVYDNSLTRKPRLVAMGNAGRDVEIADEVTWKRILEIGSETE